jgi:general nucleoside transport system ATP-binding protein
MAPEIEMQGIVKWFGNLLANDHVNLSIQKGEIRALVGENGAGKTTLMRILFGLHHPDAGTILVHGEEVRFNSPHDAIGRHIGMVHQHFMLFDDLTVTDNIIYGMEPKKAGFVDRKKAHNEVESLAGRYGFTIKPDAVLSSLSVGEKQRVEILKTLYRGAEIIILDEPTAVLTPQERDDLFKVLKNLSAQGKTIILITHKLNEVMELSNNASVMRRGEMIGTVETASTSIQELARMMVGHDILLQIDKPPCNPGNVVLGVNDLTLMDNHKRKTLDSVSFEVHGGEIVGIAGVAGNGQTELVDTLIGFKKPSRGKVLLNGADITHATITKRCEAGFAYIPEDRYRRGLAITEKICENLAMGFHRTPPISNSRIIHAKGIARWADAILKKFDVRFRSVDEPAGNLSGGNLQKIIVAREFSRPANFILADQPTRGVDIGATKFIFQQIIERRNRGDGILLISADLSEIISVSDRILVMFGGKIIANVLAKDAQEQQLGLYMAGSLQETSQAG